MALGSFAHDALIDLDDSDLDRMLELDETLFVEHKSEIGKDTAYGLVKAVASFANTVGGWLLVGVRGGKPLGSQAEWAQSEEGPTLVDVVRDRLRGEIDPLPTFEAKVFHLPEGAVGVVRVYESSDTPHVVLSSGAVYVREVAGGTDAGDPGRQGGGAHGKRVYEATKIRTRAQLLELAARGRAAKERVDGLIDPRRPVPLVSAGLDLAFEPVSESEIQPRPAEGGAIIVRVAPFTLPPRFQGWATTSYASSAVLSAVEELGLMRGLNNNWVNPDPSGASVRLPIEQGVRHRDATGGGLEAVAKVVIDGAGVAGAALQLAAPEKDRRASIRLDVLARNFIRPAIDAATGVLAKGEFIGRAWCQVDLIWLPAALTLEEASGRQARVWVPSGGDLVLPTDDAQVEGLVRRVANAYGRSAGIPAWD
jgi:Putative DNA-binding domain